MKVWFDRNMGWCVAHVLAVVLAVTLILMLDSHDTIRSAICKAEETDCVRNWMGALSGWVAAGVAAFTIKHIAGQAKLTAKQLDQSQLQLKESQLQHKIRLTLDMERSIALANKTIAQAKIAESHLDFYSRVIDEYTEAPEKAHKEILIKFAQDIADALNATCFHRFETEIGMPSHMGSAAETAKSIMKMDTAIKILSTTKSVKAARDLKKHFETVRQITNYYLNGAKETAITHIEERKELLKLAATDHHHASPPA